MNPGQMAVQLVAWILQALQLIIVVDALLTWFPSVDRRNPLVVALRRITEPIYRPIRRVIPPEKTGYIDISPVIAIFGLYLIGMILRSAFYAL